MRQQIASKQAQTKNPGKISSFSIINAPLSQRPGFSIWKTQENWYIAGSINIETG
jgi:hypothetical protein